MEDHDKERDLLVSELESLRDRISHLEALNASRQEVEKGLLETERLYRAVVESVADGIAITMRTERVFVNQAFLSIHGLRDVSEVVGHPIDQFVLPEDLRAVKERVLARQRGESLDELVEYISRGLTERYARYRPRWSGSPTRGSPPLWRSSGTSRR